MKNQNENAAVSDVTARMRTEASILAGVGGQYVSAATVAKKLREFAGSIDAAVSKTETTTPGNAAAMREALEHVEKLAREFASGNYYVSDFPKLLLDAIRPALSLPPRNCDVGTPEPPACERCRHFCGFHQMEIDFDTGDTMETVQCDARVFATPDTAEHCTYYQRKAVAQ